MAAIYADLVVPDVDPLVAARELSVDVLRERLVSLDPPGLSEPLARVWAESRLFGVDWSARGLGPPRGEVGVSLDFAALAGRGFPSQDFLPEQPADADIRLLDDPRTPPLARAVAQDSVRLAERGSRIRRPRLDAIRRVVALDQAAAASVPLGTVIDVRATWEFDFLEAFRRRLAYALGFEASLLAGSPRPYLELEALLVSDSLAGLRAYLPPASARTAFSIHLNLLARLRAALAADLPVVDAAEKDTVLSAGLHTAAERKQADLTSDAQVAVRAVLAELDVFLLRPLPYSPHPPLWGSLAPSSAYRDLGS